MLIKSIKFNNFRPFAGTQELDLTTNDDNNVVVILAQNTCGKTTIVLSFVWCFYGISRFDNPDDLLNHNVAANLPVGMTANAGVEVAFEHEGVEYSVVRTNKYKKAPNGQIIFCSSNFDVTYVDENGETKKVGTIAEDKSQAINSIMPEDLSSYFFFEGESNNKIKKKDIGDAVKKLLGLETYKNMMTHLHGSTAKVSQNSVMGHFMAKAADGNSGELSNKYDELNKCQEELEKKKKELKDLNNSKDFYQEKIDELNQALLDAAPTRELQEKREVIISALESEKERLEELYKEYCNSFTFESIDMFVMPVFAKAKKRIDEMDLSNKGIRGLDINAINELLKRQVCLCGTHLNEGSVAYDNVAAYIDIVPPREVGAYVREMLDSFDEREIKGNKYIQKFIHQYKNIQLSIQNINDLEKQEQDCWEKLKKVEGFDTSKIEADLSLYKGRVTDANSHIVAVSSRISTLSSKIDNLSKEYHELSAKSEKTKRFKLLYDYAEAVYDWVSSSYVQKESELKTKLQDYFQILFNKMYIGKRRAVITDNYELEVYNHDGTSLALTGALETIKYFSFVGALVQLASEVVADRTSEDETEAQGEFYPLVLDAAFSHTDDYHTQSVANCLSETTKQLVFAVMEKDWNFAKDGLESKVARKYTIHKISEDMSEIIEA